MSMAPVSSARRSLRIGRLSFLLDGADLRYVALDGTELLRRVGVAVRDEAWGTLEPDDLDVEVHELGEAIEVSAEARHVSAAADVAWTVTVRATAGGELSYAVELDPRAPFAYNRMGICLLHPPEALIGRRYRAQTPAGEVRGAFAPEIGAQRIEGERIFPLFPSFSALHVETGAGGELAIRFDGDLFEMEDQRNWSDGSFKTYGTPLDEPRPRRAEPGRPVRQRVELTPPAPGAASAPALVPAEPVAVGVAAEPAGTVVPGLGLVAGAAAVADDPRLRALGLAHVRVDLRVPARAPGQLALAATIAQAAGAALTVALHLDHADQLGAYAGALTPYAAAIACLLAFDASAESSPGPLVAAARERLGTALPGARFGGGTDQWFAQLNRGRPDPAAMDGVAWSITPQVHGSDDLTIVEALAAQADQVASARAFAPGLDLLVGPVTLRPRYNPAAADARRQALDPPPASIDRRQTEPFAAAWTAGSLAQLAAAGATAVTFYETGGPRGVLADDDPAAVLPCWHPLADVGGWAGWDVLPAVSAEPLAVQALAVRDPAGATLGLLVANLRDVPTRVRLDGLPTGSARLRVLDAGTRADACADPLAFRAHWSEATVAGDGTLPLALEPYAVATVLVGGPAA